MKIKVNEHIRSDSPETLVKMAKMGQGIAAMPIKHDDD
ncbi:Transcriptional regulator, LysR family protein (fragment) [Vibrio tapetis subsp. tapetis]|uniref:Transcriptional regulator, LysR family protein n=1 Tax=Vibrio tapetis subsp. tapetis TaxID=1671868 RepID=A0A2N8ZJJ8_9VIBR